MENLKVKTEPLFELGPFNDLLLLGGGSLLRDLCKWAKKNNFAIRVITSPRHATEHIEGIVLKKFLEEESIPHIVSESIASNEVHTFVGEISKTFCLSLGAAWIFKPLTIEKVFNNKLFNLHGTRLPQNRGGGGFSWQILTSNRFGFCVLHLIDGGIDTGDIIYFDEFLYPAICRIPEHYSDFYIKQNFSFITKLLEETTNKSKLIKPIAQAEYFSTYWPRLHTTTNAWIDWSWDVYELERFICAFDSPYAGAQTYLNENKIHLKNVSINFQDGAFHSYQAGLVYRKSKNWLCVCVKGAGLIIENVLDENGSDKFDAIKVGDRFFTPYEKLENVKHRVIYNATGLKT
jgi:methionyl-tRNA formyltransferase